MAKEIEIGYRESRTVTIQPKLCLLTVGSIIEFNGGKHIVTSVYPTFQREYKSINGLTREISVGSGGFLKNIETGKELRSNWSKVPKERILHFEHLEEVKKSWYQRL